MRNLSETKEYLKRAYQSVSSDFNLQEVRQAINFAFQKIENYEKKSLRREEVQKQVAKEQQEKRQVYAPVYNVKEQIELIDKMIKEEEKKIEDIRNKGTKPNDDIQAILG